MDATAQATTYLIYVWIRGIHPMLWRRFMVRAESALADIILVVEAVSNGADGEPKLLRSAKELETEGSQQISYASLQDVTTLRRSLEKSGLQIDEIQDLTSQTGLLQASLPTPLMQQRHCLFRGPAQHSGHSPHPLGLRSGRAP